jgi:hypothetical protein
MACRQACRKDTKLTVPKAVRDALVCFQEPVSTMEWVRDDLEDGYVHGELCPSSSIAEACTKDQSTITQTDDRVTGSP